MENTKERIQELEQSLNSLYHSWQVNHSASWSEEKWAEQRAIEKQQKSEFEQLIRLRKAELKSEEAELKKKYPKFGKRLRYIFKVPDEVIAAEKRCNEIFLELKRLNRIIM